MDGQTSNGAEEIEVIPSPKTTPPSVKPSESKESSFSVLPFLLVLSVAMYSVLSLHSGFKVEMTKILGTIKSYSLVDDIMEDPKKMYGIFGIISILITMMYLCMPFNNKATDGKVKTLVETTWALFLIGMIAVGVKMSLF